MNTSVQMRIYSRWGKRVRRMGIPTLLAYRVRAVHFGFPQRVRRVKWVRL